MKMSPCAAWATRLAALHPDDLTPEQRTALQDHVAGCPDCADAYAAYRAMDARILSLPAVYPSAAQMLQLQPATTEQTQDDPRWEPAAVYPEPPVRAPKGWARVGSVAAVLLVLVLAASAFALFSSRHTRVPLGSGASGTIYAVSMNGTVYAVDAASGSTIWSTPLYVQASEQFVISGGIIFLGSNDYQLYALKASTGQVLWTRSYMDLTTVGNQTVQIAPYPASDGTAIYFGTPKGIYAWRAGDGKQLWSYPTPTTCSALSGICAPEVATVANGIIYTYLDGLYALNATDGSLLWKNPSVPSDTPLVVAHNQVYVAPVNSGPMSMRVLSADTGQLLDTPNLPLPPFQTPQLITDGETIYVLTRTAGAVTLYTLYALRSSDNTVIWQKQYIDHIRQWLLGVDAGKLYYGAETITAASPAQPSPVSTPTQWAALPTESVPAIHFSVMTAQVCTVSAVDGTALGCYHLPVTFQPLVVSQGTLYSTGAGIDAIRLRDGTVLWSALANVELAHIELD